MGIRYTLDDSTRRRVLRLGVAGLCVAASLPARAALTQGAPRRLSFEHLHTGDRASLVYWADGAYLPGALDEMDILLRDFRTDEAIRMEAALYDLLHALKIRLATEAPFQVISGYRSPRTNRVLARRSRGVAFNSLHQYGMAIDVRVPGVRLRDLRGAARSLGLGGVGYYPRSDFIHVDTGRVRFW
ncbi:MAG: DUF882 domain-containing protein [Alphaproteobacteria bacterium]